MRLRFCQIGTDPRAGRVESWAFAHDGTLVRARGGEIPDIAATLAEGRVETGRGVGSVFSSLQAIDLKPVLRTLSREFPGTRWLVFHTKD